MKITAFSDGHGILPRITNDPDLILIAGDICQHGSALQQLRWLDTTFRVWLRSIECSVIGIAGNHDWVFYEKKQDVQNLELPWTYLEDSGKRFGEFNIWGSPWQVTFNDWAFNLSEDKLSLAWDLIPDHIDILITHSPPFGFGDLAYGKHLGSPSLYERVNCVQPKLHIFGHIHEGRGNYEFGASKLGNVTILDERYRNVYAPAEYEL